MEEVFLSRVATREEDEERLLEGLPAAIQPDSKRFFLDRDGNESVSELLHHVRQKKNPRCFFLFITRDFYFKYFVSKI